MSEVEEVEEVEEVIERPESSEPSHQHKETPARRKIREEDEENVHDYLRDLAADTPVRISLLRKYPKSWQGRPIEGTIDNYEEPISVEDIRDAHGGGTYHLRISTPNSQGKWTYLTGKTLKIAGDPKLDGLPTTPRGDNGGDSSVVKEALRMSQAMVDRAHRRVDRAEERGSVSPDPTIGLMIQGLQAELHEMRRALDMKDQRIHELLTNPARNSHDVLLEKMVDGESGRVTAIRTQVESEIRAMRERYTAEIERLHQRNEDQTKRQEDAHKREIDNLIRTHDARVESLKLAQSAVEQGFQREIGHLGRQLTVAQTEVAELRAKKDRTVVETVTELATVKEALEVFKGESEGDGSSTIERILKGVLDSSLAEGVAARLAGGVAPGVSEAPPSSPSLPPNQPIRLPDGRVIVQRADGTMVQLRRKASGTADTAPAIDAKDLETAVEFMEGAVRNDTDPADFAASARNLIPEPILSALRSQGVDRFLANVAKLKSDSPLYSQHGKNWVRKVASILIGS